MSEVYLSHNSGLKRTLYSHETELIKFLGTGRLDAAQIDIALESHVEDMNDGGMGSIHFLHKGNCEIKSNELLLVLFKDTDGVDVYITVLESGNRIHELDFWKTDFSALQRYPTPQDIIFNVNAISISELKNL